MDSSGVPVYSEERPVSAGTAQFDWNGTTSTGAVAPNGTYTLSIAAANSSGIALNISTETIGIVQGVDLSGNEPVLLVDGQEVNLGQIKSVRRVSSGMTETGQPSPPAQ